MKKGMGQKGVPRGTENMDPHRTHLPPTQTFVWRVTQSFLLKDCVTSQTKVWAGGYARISGMRIETGKVSFLSRE